MGFLLQTSLSPLSSVSRQIDFLLLFFLLGIIIWRLFQGTDWGIESRVREDSRNSQKIILTRSELFRSHSLDQNTGSFDESQ